MSYDLAVSMDQNTLNGALSQMFALPRLAGMFTGQLTQDILGSTATVTWTIQQAPQISLAQPTTDQWKNAIDAQGNHPTPVANAGVLTLPALNVQFQYQGDSGSSTVAASAIWTWTVNNGTLVLTPVGAIVDTSGLSDPWPLIVTNIILPLVMQKAQSFTETVTLPNVQYGGVNFGTPAFTITSGRVVMVAAMAGQPTPAIPDVSTLPNQPLFVQVSQGALQNAVTSYLQPLIGKSESFSGSKDSANYSGTVTLQSATVTLDANDPTKASGSVGYGLTADVSALDGACGLSAAASSF